VSQSLPLQTRTTSPIFLSARHGRTAVTVLAGSQYSNRVSFHHPEKSPSWVEEQWRSGGNDWVVTNDTPQYQLGTLVSARVL
jgi:hypothetical protein